MRNLILLLALFIGLCSCTNYGRCSKDDMYHSHNFEITSIYPRHIEGYKWYISECSKCGLSMAWNTDLCTKKGHYPVVLIKSTSTNKYDIWCKHYIDGKEYIIPISKSDVKESH